MRPRAFWLLGAFCALLAACASSPGQATGGHDAPPPHHNPIAGRTLYADNSGLAAQAVQQLYSEGQSQTARELLTISRQPQAIWLPGTPNDANTIATATSNAQAAGSLPVFVMYNIPDRNCGGPSAGGAPSQAVYTAWFHADAAAVHGPAVFIIEPDLIPELATGCKGANEAADLAMIKDEVQTLRFVGALVYIDAGNSNWVKDPARLLPLLQQAGIASASGISLNVANFQPTAAEVSYGQQLAKLLGGKGVIIDTSRNGGTTPPTGDTCNPAGVGLGRPPTTVTHAAYIDAFMWVKPPGVSDGAGPGCNGGPQAGQWWQTYALGLIEGHTR